ncbi:MAG: hypothetical protein HOC71_19270 [Candidatus Latescibacteria bacterium]|jgi:hypothetical protein|nr:hypothetical protein [Desulfobacteraceae bacterium]MBT4485815.1 hypothetical protein [Candidatus Latescibacterota bacterium]
MRKLIVFITIVFLLSAAAEPLTQGFGKKIVFLPFYDESNYRGPWDLRYDIPEMLGDMVGGADDYFYIVPMDTVRNIMFKPEKKSRIKKFLGLFMNRKRPQKILTDSEITTVARKLDGDFVITGVISDFNMRRVKATEPMVGGYGSYNTKVGFEQVRVLRVSDGRPLGSVKGDDSKKSRGLGLELFGKPRRLDLEFYSLDSLDFGSKRFINTLLGQTTVEALNKVNKELHTIITKPDSNWYEAKKFRVLSIDAGIVVINAGSEDGVSPGDEFTIFTSESGVRVGKIRVIAIWSPHVSKAEILDGKDEIRPEDRIMPE